MDVVNESSPAPRLRRIPFLVRLAPEFLSRLTASASGNGSAFSRMNGLLFGLAETEAVVIQVFRSLSSQTGGTEPSRTKPSLQASFEELIARSKSDPELAGLKLLGWFSGPKPDGLQDEEIAFHDNNFGNLNDLALIIRNEPGGYLSLELYCRSLDGTFSNAQNRWGTVRVSSVSPLESPVEVPMRTKIHDDLYMRAYQFSERDEDDESVSGWKELLAKGTIKAFRRVKTSKPDEKAESAIPENKPEKSALDNLRGVTSMSQALQYARHEGGAVAPAAIKEEPPEPRETVAERKEPVQRIDAEEPVPTSSRQQPPPVAPSEEGLAARDGKQATPQARSESHSQAVPIYAPVSSQVLGLNSAPTPSAAPPVRTAELVHIPAQGGRRLPWLALGAVFAVSTGGTFGFIYLKDAYANSTLPGFLQAVLPSTGLHLRISGSGERVQLSWNRNTPAAKNGRDGILEIRDGSNRREIRLTAAEIANGSILYLPKTDDVVFRLEIHGAAGQKVSESLSLPSTLKSTKVVVSQSPKQRTQMRNALPAISSSKSAANRPKVTGKKSADPAGITPTTPRIQRGPTSDLKSKNQNAIENGRVPASQSARSTIHPAPRNGTAQAHEEELPQPGGRTKPPKQDLPGQDGSDRAVASQSLGPDRSKPAQTNPAVTTPLRAYRPPRPIKQVLPNVSALPAGMPDAAGEVRVVVRVNELGEVADARIVETNDNVGPDLRTAALTAARQWVFAPASLNGKDVASDHTILFHFRR